MYSFIKSQAQKQNLALFQLIQSRKEKEKQEKKKRKKEKSRKKSRFTHSLKVTYLDWKRTELKSYPSALSQTFPDNF